MGRPRLDKVNMSFSLDRDIYDALEMVKNKSEVVNAILRDNIHMVGEMSTEDTKRLRIKAIENDIEEGIVHGLRTVANKVKSKEVDVFKED
jgi:hypothetical protein